jgi:hypothetical protein
MARNYPSGDHAGEHAPKKDDDQVLGFTDAIP